MMKFNKKKTIKSSLFLLTPTLLATAITPVVSCNNNPKTEELTFWEKFNNLNLNLSLNSEGKKKTASEFYKEAKSGSIYSVLSKYTNYNSFLQSIITNLDAEVKAINSINLSNSGSSVSLNIKIGEMSAVLMFRTDMQTYSLSWSDGRYEYSLEAHSSEITKEDLISFAKTLRLKQIVCS